MRHFRVSKFSIILFLSVISSPAFSQNCGDVVTSNIRLTNNLHCGLGYQIFDVQADNVVIDLNGYTLSGTSSMQGIHNYGYSNMTVKNGTIKDVEVGVITAKSTGLVVSDITFYETRSGVNIQRSSNALIQNNKFIRQSGASVNLVNNDINDTTNNNRIENNEFYQTALGVRFCGVNAESNTVVSNVFWRSRGFAISVETANRNFISKNRIIEPTITPIRLVSASYNRIIGNTLVAHRPDNGVATPSGILVTANNNTNCAGGGLMTSVGNSILTNYLMNFPTGIVVGTGVRHSPFNIFFDIPSSDISRNSIAGNTVVNSQVGIELKVDTHQNNLQNNKYRDVGQAIKNSGLANTISN